MKKILITGGSGFLAKRVGDYIAEDPGMIVLLPTHSELDITSKDNCRKWFEDNMPELKQKRLQEDIDRINQIEETRQRNAERMDHYYGDGNSSLRKRRPHIFYFKPEDLDNEDVILAVENTPTYKRNREALNEIKKMSTVQVQGDSKEEETTAEETSGKIQFA